MPVCIWILCRGTMLKSSVRFARCLPCLVACLGSCRDPAPHMRTRGSALCGSTVHCRRCNARRLPDPSDPSLDTSRPNSAHTFAQQRWLTACSLPTPARQQAVSTCKEVGLLPCSAQHTLTLGCRADFQRRCNYFPRPQRADGRFQQASTPSHVTHIHLYTSHMHLQVYFNLHTHTQRIDFSVASLCHYGIKLFPE